MVSLNVIFAACGQQVPGFLRSEVVLSVKDISVLTFSTVTELPRSPVWEMVNWSTDSPTLQVAVRRERVGADSRALILLSAQPGCWARGWPGWWTCGNNLVTDAETESCTPAPSRVIFWVTKFCYVLKQIYSSLLNSYSKLYFFSTNLSAIINNY